jgi:hypothetical protein
VPIDVWCSRYGVPPGFADGSWRQGHPGHEGPARRYLLRGR